MMLGAVKGLIRAGRAVVGKLVYNADRRRCSARGSWHGLPARERSRPGEGVKKSSNSVSPLRH